MADKSLTTLGANIAKARETAGMSRLEIAAITGISSNSIGNIESGRQNTSVNVLLGIAAAIGASPETLMKGVGIDPEKMEQVKAIREEIARNEMRIKILLSGLEPDDVMED